MSKLTSISHLRDEFALIYDQTGSYRETARILCRKYPELPNPNWTRGLIREELRIHNPDHIKRREKQLESDLKRQKRKVEREQDRQQNAIEALLGEIKTNLKGMSRKLVAKQRYSQKYDPHNSVMVVHLSDLHLQAVIETSSNQFDFIVASRRLALLAQRIKLLAETYGAQKAVVCMGGDFLKNDKRADEYLTNACNRSKSVVLSVHLLRQFLQDLRQVLYLEVVSVAGNESRTKEAIGWSEEAVTDNYDSLIYWMLEMVMKDDDGIVWHPHQGNEQVFCVNNEAFLLLHGHQLNFSQQKSVQSVMGKYATQGINITHVIGGHIHSACISDYSSRSSSLCGGDAYAQSALGYASKASQNIHIVSSSGMDSVRIDLQNTKGIRGYDCLDKTIRFGARTADRTNLTHQIKPIQVK